MEAIVCLPGKGDQVTDEEKRYVEIKAGLDELALTESRYGEGESGPSAHVHREHSDSFWVLDGELTFELGGGTIAKGSAGTFVLVPPMVVHTFRNEGPGDARFLNLHAPSMGFHDYLRAKRDAGDDEKEEIEERFDTFDPPPDGGRPASDALLVGAGEGETIPFGGGAITFKAGREHSGGVLSLTESTIPAGFPGPVPHYHEAMVDSFYVLEGRLTIRLDGRLLEAPPGSYALAPPGCVHTFSNPGTDTVRMLNVMAPGGLEQYLKEVAAAIKPGEAPNPGLMARIASKYDFHPA
jgi:mannose-6-phosphate isomerase-like protein (cupin superfamily)